MEETRVISLNIITHTKSSPCHFWVGNFGLGSEQVSALLKADDARAVLERAANTGLVHEEPVVLVDAEVKPQANFYYLMPVQKWPGDPGLTQLREGFQSALYPWKPESIGFYLAPGASEDEESMAKLLLFVQTSLNQQSLKALYFLVGRFGLNAVLNMALKAKAKYEDEHLALKVYH